MHPMKRSGVVKASDRSIALNFGLKPVDQTALEDGPIYQMTDAGPACTRRVRATPERPPVRIWIRVFPHSLSHTHLLAATISSEDGLEISITERARQYFSEVGRGH